MPPKNNFTDLKTHKIWQELSSDIVKQYEQKSDKIIREMMLIEKKVMKRVDDDRYANVLHALQLAQQ